MKICLPKFEKQVKHYIQETAYVYRYSSIILVTNISMDKIHVTKIQAKQLNGQQNVNRMFSVLELHTLWYSSTDLDTEINSEVRQWSYPDFKHIYLL